MVTTVLFIALFMGVAGLTLREPLRKALAKRKMRNLRTTQIREAQDGQMVKLIGRLGYGPRRLAAPLSKRVCTHYRLLLEEEDGDSWKRLVEDVDSADFILLDGTGKARVDMSQAEVIVGLDREERSGIGHDASEALTLFLAERGQSSTGLIFNRRLRCREGVLEEGATVAVVGLACWEADPEPDPTSKFDGGYRDGPQSLKVTAHAPKGVLVSNALDVIAS